MSVRIFAFLFLVSTLLAACSNLGIDTNQESGYPAPVINPSPSPIENQDSSLAYPQYNDGDEISWNIAVTILLNGEVDKVRTQDAQKVILFLKDGRSLITLQPFENEIQTWIEKCGETCNDIQVETE